MAENIEEEEKSDEVKSSCLIKFQATDQLPFSTLECSLDLRRPPSNWLNGQIKNPKSANYYKFSSFKMAFDFFEETGSVDVISDSENIKNLLKIAYDPNGMLSYFVHRVGNTLLIDDFNLHRYLMWSSEKDWSWLRSFIFENILTRMKDKSIPIQQKTKQFLEQKNLLSKFLYYSIEDAQKTEEKEYVPCLSFSNALLPQAKPEDIPDNHQYSRNVLWNFEDIRMLIGSDMQIFGNQSRPCISLRLRDMKEPISILTGIDFWLDNLMCNVPEIFMCYHLNGIVQRYELIKTEDLPNMEDSRFSPKVIRNVAHNILSFLKTNATKAGHTYWLFKAKNDDVVKLYDLTTLELLAQEKQNTSNESENKSDDDNEKKEDQNPFTVPVGILLYTVARNMKYSNEKLTTKQAGNIKQLLDNCLKLLPKEKYPQIITTSHYILSDIQIQAGLDPMNPVIPYNEDQSDSDEGNEEFEYEGEESEDDLDPKGTDLCPPAMQNIKETMSENLGSNSSHGHQSVPLQLGNIYERSQESLKNIMAGLQALKYFQSDVSLAQEKQRQKEQIIHEEQNPNLLQNPEIPIPMGWNEDRKSRSSSKRGDSPTESESNNSTNGNINLDSKSLLMRGSPNVKSWNTHLKVLLFEKASLAYACLAEDFYNSKNYGATLKSLRYSISCENIVKKYVPTLTTQKSVLYGRAGDCYFQMSKSYDKITNYIDEFVNESEMDRDFWKELEKEQNDKETEDDFQLPNENEEKLLELSCQCYETSLIDTNQSQIELVRRLGNAYNELGVALMHKAQRLYSSYMDTKKANTDSDINNEDAIDTKEMSYREVAKKSYDYLMKAVTLFDGVKDNINLIVCHLNLGRFFRLSAHINMFYETTSLKSFQMQKKMYYQAFDSYNQALSILRHRKENPDLWDHVSWELSTATFNLAKEMQENSSYDGSAEDLEREVLDILTKALKYCDIETNSSRQVLYIFRAGLIHQRLASFYHQSLRMITDETKRKNLLQLCRLHYEKAANLLASLNEFKDYFKVQVERIALSEFLAEESVSNQTKIKNLQSALTHFIDTSKMLKDMSSIKLVIDSDEVLSLLELFEKRLQFVLKSLTKLTMAGKKVDQKAEIYKKMFGLTLRSNQKLDLMDLNNHLIKVLENINAVNQQIGKWKSS
ncbi:unnamed protein product [Chironomus riparius]|uniref:Erythroid differentiation-related factor 1 n=1 Tax=Chironomus riparius TaxID=315576 RepID=A0A9N9RUC3_9DIPT|nr:unnamed protein product [Chironomus riparius]